MGRCQSSGRLLYWLTMCVFIICQDLAVLATNGSQRKRSISRKYQKANTTPALGDETGYPLHPCNDWEWYDGDECVCASNVTSRCHGDGGVVCDDQGRMYDSACDFAVRLCDGQLPMETDLRSCGACDLLKLTNSQTYPDLRAEFIRTGVDQDNKPIYRSTNMDGVQLFFLKEWNTWVVGLHNESETMISMRMRQGSVYPEDSKGGIVYAIRNNTTGEVTWEFDSSLHFECVHHSSAARVKRFFWFVAFAFVGLASSATATTLKIVQVKKGCLYYPSVCRLRDEIEKKLKPEISTLKGRFNSATGGDATKYKEALDEVVNQVLDIQDNLVTIRQLQIRLNGSLSNLGTLYAGLPDQIINVDDLKLNYQEWLSQIRSEAALSLVAFEVELLITLPGLIAGATSTAAIALAGIGAAFAVVTSVVDIVSSVKEERKIRDSLRKTKNTLVEARTKLNKALENIRQFGVKFCRTAVKFLRRLAYNGRNYHYSFSRMRSYIDNNYGLASSSCDASKVYSKISFNNVRIFSNVYIKPVLNLLKNNVDRLRQTIRKVEEMKVFLSAIRKDIIDGKSPKEVYHSIKSGKPELTSKVFGSLFYLVKHIAEKIYPNKECLWGYNLKAVRDGSVTEPVYLQTPICPSPEIDISVALIKGYVEEGLNPCRIFLRTRGEIFRSAYLVVKYIADYILPHTSVYSEYDLVKIRSNEVSVTDIDATCDFPFL